MGALMPQPVSFAVFFGAFVCAAVYLVCVFKLAERLRDLKRRGRALEAPNIEFSVAGIPATIWLATGRYAKLGDEAVTRWSSIARILLFALIPLYMLMMADVILGVVSNA